MITGPVSISPRAAFDAIFRGADDTPARVLLSLRLPRALLGVLVGGALASSGVAFQALLRNPLADPYILGVSGGAAVAALGAMVLGLAGVWIPVGAAAGALTAYPGDLAAPPGVETVRFRAGQTRANNALVGLACLEAHQLSRRPLFRAAAAGTGAATASCPANSTTAPTSTG